MTKEEVLQLLETNKDERGIKHWNRLRFGNLSSYGIGLTRLKKLAKQIGRDHQLALELWELPIYDAKILATIIDNPREITEDQVNRQIRETGFWLLCHSYCSNLLAKTSFVQKKAEEWAVSKDDLLRRCGYQMLCHIAKDNKSLDNAYFQPYLKVIEKTIQSEENFVKDAMNNALWMIGQRSKPLNARAIEIAKKIGKIEVDYGDNSCQAIDVLKHLTGERVQQKFAKR